MHFSSRRNLFIAAAVILSATALTKPVCGQAQPSQPAKKSPVGPAAPQSTHYPILLLAFGDDPMWSLRIGLKGPQRLDRPNYPPIPLDPAEVTHEGAADSWTYHAKDAATGAAVAVHLTREPCAEAATDPTSAPRPSTGKYTFRVTVDHAQLGSLKGCARIAAELFPKINNQADDSDDDKNKPPAPTITNFKPPVAVAYLNATGNIVVSRGAIKKIVAPAGTELSLSHDGKKLLYTRSDSKSGPERTIVLYDADTGKMQELVKGLVRQAFWSPDDSRIAFLKAQDRAWQIWSFPATAAPESAALFSPQQVNSLHGWTDGHTVLTSDMQNAYWLSEDKPLQTVDLKEIYGPTFQIMSSDALRVHPINADLLLVSANFTAAPAGAPKDAMGLTAGFFLYELRSKRRTVLSPPDQWSRAAEWSRDGLQAFYTRMVSGASSTFRIFWDGTSVQKFVPGTFLVVGK